MNATPLSTDSADRPTAAELQDSLVATARHLQRIGVLHFPAGDAEAGRQWLAEQAAPAVSESVPAAPAAAPTSSAPPPPVAPAAPSAAPAPAAAAPAGEAQTPYPASLPLADRQTQLAQLATQVASCVRCDELVCYRRQTVFGEGNPQARVAFFGEAPGAEEDQQGRPFVGRAGQLLTKMIEACTLRREDVYILNTLKCRPPENRNPLPHELDNCRPYFEAQLNLIQPEYIVCLGLFAAQSLLRSKLSVGRLRGRFHAYHHSKVLVTYHPSYLLRTASAKRLAWEDLQIMMADMGVRR